MDFHVEWILDDTGYPRTVLIDDTDKEIGSYRRPLRFNITELERLYEALSKILKYYKEWDAAYNDYRSDKITKEDFLAAVKGLIEKHGVNPAFFF